MPIPNYRVNLSFDADRKVFIARAPELPHCSGEGATRAEAISRVEEEIGAQVENMLAAGSNPPASVDELNLDGAISTKVSQTLHRDLVWQARQEGVELSQLLAELIASALEARRGGGRGPQRAQSRPAADPDSIGNREPRGGAGGGRSGYGGRYNPQLMEDRANFIEYVRNLEHGQQAPQGPGRSGGDPNRNRDRGGRRRGGGGGGGGGGGNGGNRGPGGAQNAGGGGNGGGGRF